VSDSFPRAALLACWLNAHLSGAVPVERVAAVVRGEDAAHVVAGYDGSFEDYLARLPGQGVTAALPALPVPGDPLGLAGPAPFGQEALEAGGAVVLAGSGVGLVPRPDVRVVLWSPYPAEVPRERLDPREHGSALRRALLDVTRRLAELDVASWQPDIPDLLMNLRHRPVVPLPPGTPPDVVDTVERAALCLDVVALAAADDGGAVTAHEMRRRHDALRDLDRSARRALVACCGPGPDSLGPS
jgi:hypothetical protein